MSTLTDAFTTAQGQTLDFVRKSQETAAEAFQTWSEQVKGFVPEQFTLPSFGADWVPAPTQIVETMFAFAEGVLAAQRDFALKVAGSTESLIPEPKTAEAPAAKSSAK